MNYNNLAIFLISKLTNIEIINKEGIFIVTKRFIIAKPSIYEYHLLNKLQSDPDVMKYFGGPRTPQVVWQKMELFLEHYEKHGFSYGCVFRKSDYAFVGRCGFIHFDFNDNTPDLELGYLVLKEFWNQGYATEFAEALKKYVFETLGKDKVYAKVSHNNIYSIKFLEKIGMQYIKDVPGYFEKFEALYMVKSQIII